MGLRRRLRPVEVVELDERSRLVLARRHPEVVGHGAALVIGAAPELQSAMARAVAELARAANDNEHRQVEELIESLLPAIEVRSPAAMEEARRQAHIRTRILQDFGAWTAAEVADLARSTAANRSSLAGRWRAQNRIFGVPYRGSWWYLGFQFGDDGRPVPVVADVLRALAGWDAWAIAEWFVLHNPGLNRSRPVDLLETDPDAVVHAARVAADVERGAPRPTRGGMPPGGPASLDVLA